MPHITVIIPNYNHGSFLDRRLRSVLVQTVPDTEIIFLDDASTDNSRQIVEGFMDEGRVRSVFNEVNSGSPFEQWNKGVQMARGQYVWIAEADDVADSRLLERLVAVLDAHPNVGLAYCDSWLMDAAGQTTGRASQWTQALHPDRWHADYINSGRDECARYLLHKCVMPNASAIVFRRELYQRVGGADEHMKLSADWLTWAKLLMESDVAYIAEPLNYFRRHANSVSAEFLHGRVGFEERLQVVAYILGTLRVTPADRSLAVETLSKQWANLWRARPRKITFWDNLRLRRLACRVDPSLPRQTLKRVLRSSIAPPPALAPLPTRSQSAGNSRRFRTE